MEPLAAIVTLLKPKPMGTKIIHGRGRWGVRYPAFGHPSFALGLKGKCLLAVEKARPITLETGDFVLFPAMPGFTMKSDRGAECRLAKPAPSGELVEEIFHGDSTGDPSVTLLGGYFAFDPINAALLLSFLPKMLRLQGTSPAGDTVALVVEMIRREAKSERPARTFVLTRLIEALLVEALRSAPIELHSTGLLAGLRDPQTAAALRAIHAHTSAPWTLATLAREAGMSRSSFAERFQRVVGYTPLGYLLHWRLGVARHLLAHEGKSVAETAMAVGYESASGFSTAFSRETGLSPREFAHAHRA